MLTGINLSGYPDKLIPKPLLSRGLSQKRLARGLIPAMVFGILQGNG